eukprot:scaffold23125_cov91-Cyclotella_meneghiniana.AAC.11
MKPQSNISLFGSNGDDKRADLGSITFSVIIIILHPLLQLEKFVFNVKDELKNTKISIESQTYLLDMMAKPCNS